jgi:hypothetical protein
MVGSILCLALACPPADLPRTLDWIRGTGRRHWIQRLEFRCDDRRNWCKRGLEGVRRGK